MCLLSAGQLPKARGLEALGYLFTHLSFSWFRSSRAPSPGEGTSQTHCRKLADGEAAWLLSANRQRISRCGAQAGLACDCPSLACEPAHSHLGRVFPAYLQSSALQVVIPLGIWKTSQAIILSQHPFFSYFHNLLLACMGFSAGIEQSSTLPAAFIRTRTLNQFI